MQLAKLLHSVDTQLYTRQLEDFDIRVFNAIGVLFYDADGRSFTVDGLNPARLTEPMELDIAEYFATSGVISDEQVVHLQLNVIAEREETKLLGTIIKTEDGTISKVVHHYPIEKRLNILRITRELS